MSTKVAQLYDKLFLFLLKDREERTPDLKFSLRQRNNNSRLAKGYWFQGTDRYIFIPFYKRGDSNNKTKTIGFVITLDEEGNPTSNYLELAYPAEQEKRVVQFYQDLMDNFAAKEQVVFKSFGKKRYRYYYPSLDLLRT